MVLSVVGCWFLENWVKCFVGCLLVETGLKCFGVLVVRDCVELLWGVGW
jgi:hypothetical protein